MARENILIIEDEKNIAELVKYNLEQEGFRVSVSERGDNGLEEALKARHALLILDLMLPEMGGLEICRVLKQKEKTASIPIIMLTAKSEETDQVVGLEIGADDYVTKPFSPRELVARVKAVLRRNRPPQPEVLRAGALQMDTARHIVTVKSRTVELTSKEYELLKALLEVRGRVLSRDHLLETVWGYDDSIDIETRTVDMHVGQLRKKLKSEAHRILTVKNAGYRLDSESPE
jgi:DNA-binding response OmpR family regulator